MNKKIVWLILSCLMVSALVLTSCGGEEEEVTVPTEEEEEVEGNWWDVYGEPQYGGTITLARTTEWTTLDPAFSVGGSNLGQGWYEGLGTIDWTVDRKIFDHKTTFRPIEYRTGLIAESWDIPDLQTIIFHVRKGIHWQDKSPVNGRELTAYDIEYHFHRLTGTGSGFTEAVPTLATTLQPPMLNSITATDKYTVVFKSEASSLLHLENRLDPGTPYAQIASREVVEKYGDAREWENTVGTGPFILVEHVAATSYTCVRNPNYWGYDELHPQNQMPYADELKFLIIPDFATSVAALRTGKIDLMERLNWEQAGSLAKTNPELTQITIPSSGYGMPMRVDKAPLNDIRVRKAMQMAIDRETIAKTYFGGHADPTISARFGTVYEGWYTPFDEQPKEVQEGYAYNPEEAKKLLAEAGYPNGFKTNVVCTGDTDLLQIAQAYLAEIGVDMEIRLMDGAAYNAFLRANEHDGMYIHTPPLANPRICAQTYYSKDSRNHTLHNDPVYDEMYLNFFAAPDWDTAKTLAREAGDYAMSKQWHIVLVGTTEIFSVCQPYLKGYGGEAQTIGHYMAHWWVDQDLKKAMGR